MCGPTGAQSQDLESMQNLQRQLQTESANTYGEEQGILSKMTAAYEPIVAAGPNQEGFSAAEKNTMDTQADEGVAQNYQQASRAIRENQAAEGGGDSYVPSGAEEALREGVTEAAAGQRSSEQLAITKADYDQGHTNYEEAAQNLAGTAQLINPLGYAGETTATGEAVGSEANTLAAQSNSWMAPVLGAVGAVGGGLAGRIGKP